MTESQLLDLYLKHSDLGEVCFDQFKDALTEYESSEIARLRGIIERAKNLKSFGVNDGDMPWTAWSAVDADDLRLILSEAEEQ